jgi:glutathione synthase/RimK-type ligase-like ATP-grasp enzyme
MILIVTNQYDPTADIVVRELHRRRAEFARFNTEEFPLGVRLTWSISSDAPLQAELDLGHGRFVALANLQSIYYRRPKPFVLSPQLQAKEARVFALGECQAAINGLWETADCFWLNHPRNIKAASSKLRQLQRAAELGLAVPRTLVTNDPQAVRDFRAACDGEVVAKVLHNGMIEAEHRLGLIYTTRLGDAQLAKLDGIKHAPCIFQEYVPKQVEIRATVVGSRVFAVEIHSQCSERTRTDWRRYDLPNTPHRVHVLPAWLERKCLEMVEGYGLSFGAIDLILTPAGEYVFLELNPNGQWGWLEQLTGVPICNAIADLLMEPSLQAVC